MSMEDRIRAQLHARLAREFDALLARLQAAEAVCEAARMLPGGHLTHLSDRWYAIQDALAAWEETRK